MKYPYIFIYLLLVIFSFFEGCKTSGKNNTLSAENLNSIAIYQNEKEKIIKSGSATIYLKKDDFSIRILNKAYNPAAKEFYAAQIAALVSKDDFSKVEPGMKKEEISFLEPGSGIASSISGAYESLIFNNNGHHYLFYENEDSKRLNLIEDYGEFKKLEFNISSILSNNEVIKIKNTTLEKFYLVVFMDRNLNKVIEAEELFKLIIKLE